MATNTFLPYSLLTADALNTAMTSKLDLTVYNTQQILGPVTVPNLTATIGLQTQDLTVTGNTIFSTTSGIQLPVGNTLQRPSNGNPGWLRVNTDSGLMEVLLPSGRWVNLTTVTATQSPATPPSSLASVQFGAASSTSIPLSWSVPVGGTAPFTYIISYRLSGTASWTVWASSLTGLTTTISSLLPGSRYEFYVTAENIAGSVSSQVSATATLGSSSSGGPTNLSTFSATSTSISLSWTAVTSSVPVAYVVQYALANVNTWTTFGVAISGTTTTVTGLSPNSIYNFQVIAKTVGNSYNSSVIQGTTTVAASVAPNTVGTLTFSNLATSSLTVTWNAPTAGTSPFLYQLEYQVNGGSIWYNYGPATTATTLNLLSLTSADVYSFRVTATNSMGVAISQPYPITMLTQTPDTGQCAEYQWSSQTAPIIYGPRVGQVKGGAVLDLLGIGLLDPVAGYTSGSLLLSVKAGSGTITMTDAIASQVTGSGTSSISKFATTLQGANTSLNSLTYTAPALTGNTNSSDSVTITVTDQAANTASMSISITIIPTAVSVPATPVTTGSPSTTGYTATGQPTDKSGATAYRSNVLSNNFGVGTNFGSGFYGPDFTPTSAAVIENSINYIAGVSFVRESGFLNMINEGPFLQMIAQNTGVQYILEISGGTANMMTNNATAWQNAINNIMSFGLFYPEYLVGIQGVNTAGFASNGILTDAFSASQSVNFQSEVAAVAATLNVLAFQQELDYTLTGGGGPANYGLSSVFPETCPSAGYAVTSAGGQIAASALSSTNITPNKPTLTQIGYQSFPNTGVPFSGTNFVDQLTQAKYALETLLDLTIATLSTNNQLVVPSAFNLWYQLYDTPVSTYGLFSGFGGAPKKSGVVLSNVFNLLNDSGIAASTFTPGALDYTISGSTPSQYGTYTFTGLKQLLLQNSQGNFFLILYNEQPLNVRGTNAEISVSPITLTITFNENVMHQVSVIDYYTQTNVTSGSVSTLSFSLPPYPIILMIEHP
jgi:hypothetical protein